MIFGKRLCEALEIIPLTQIDPRLNSNSKLTKISANLDQTRGPGRTKVLSLPPPVYTNLRRQKLPLSDSVIREAAPAPTEAPPAASPAVPGQEDALEITDADLPKREAPGTQPETPPETQETIPGLPSGSKYTLQQAKGQLDGIVKQWMDLAGNYPEGEQRHNFLEIGERLREISAVINRDFLQAGGQPKTPPAPPAPPAPETAPPQPQQAQARQ